MPVTTGRFDVAHALVTPGAAKSPKPTGVGLVEQGANTSWMAHTGHPGDREG